MTKKLILLCAFMAIAWIAKSQNLVIQGIVRDSITNEPLPYVSILLKGTTIGTTTGIDGDFYLTTSAKAHEVEVSYLGYETKTLKVTPGRKFKFTVELRPTSIDLTEVIVKPKKEKYSKKENPAVIFVRKVIERREANDPRIIITWYF